MAIVQIEIVENGDELPCHKSNIIHTEEISATSSVARRNRLRIWYIETEGAYDG